MQAEDGGFVASGPLRAAFADDGSLFVDDSTNH
jgi:hypothetical protein